MTPSPLDESKKAVIQAIDVLDGASEMLGRDGRFLLSIPITIKLLIETFGIEDKKP